MTLKLSIFPEKDQPAYFEVVQSICVTCPVGIHILMFIVCAISGEYNEILLVAV